MSEWPETTLGEICAEGGGFIRTGPFGSQLHQSDYVDDSTGIPVVMPKDMAHGRVDRSSIARIDAETADRLSHHLLAAGDVALSRRGDVGRSAWIGPEDLPILCGTGSMRVHAGVPRSVDPAYLRYFFRSRLAIDYLEGQAVGATMPNLNADIVKGMPVPVLPLERQRLAADVLASIEELIDNNRQRVEMLEEMARAIYREWFVRFRYPGHDDIPLVDSPLGPIPGGCAVRSLGELSTNHDRRRRPLSKAQRAERQGSFPYYGAARLIDWVDGWIFDGEHLLFAEDGTVQTADGFPVLQLVEGKFWANNHTHILEGRDVSTRFLFLACAVQPITGYVTGAAQPKITQANLNRLALVVATPDIRRHFDAIVDPIFDQWRVLQRSIAPLAALRDLLLPKLVTGQIDVSYLDLDALAQAAST